MNRMLVPVLLALAGCAASRAVAPLEEGQTALTASVGGPLFELGGLPLPAPISAVGVAHGLSARTTVHGALYPTQLLLLGVVGLDAGVSTEVLPPLGARPRLMVDGTLYAFAGDNTSGEPRGGLRLFPDLSAIASWDLGRRRHHLYTGVDLFLQPFPALHLYPSPVAGGVLRLGDAVGLQAEVKWLALHAHNLPNFVDWIAPAHRGAVSVQLGATVSLGGGR